MIARKKSGRTTKRQRLGALISDHKRATENMEAALNDVAENYYARDLVRLKFGITEVNRIINELELLVGGAP